jgi:hypothetical protein
MWQPKERDYAAEAVARACATSVPERHPLQEAVERLEAIQKKEEEAAEAVAKGAPPPKAPEEIVDPLGAASDPLGASDPLSSNKPLGAKPVGAASSNPLSDDPLGVLGDPLGEPSKLDMSVVAASGRNPVIAPPPLEEHARRTWRDRRAMILKQYAATGTMRVNQDILDSKGGDASKLGSNIDEAGPSGEKKVMLDHKTRGRLEQIEAATAVEQGRTINMTQSKLVESVDSLNKELRAAWNGQERVRALKIAIQVSKMLGDTSFPTFFPTVFAVVAEILDAFGELVYERVLDKGKPPGKKLPPGYTPAEITEEGKETTKNWFYKVASIRELVPRFYVELSILRCYRLLIDSSELPGIVQRLARMIRGFGDPLAATYARSYLVHKAIDLTPSSAHLLVKEPVLDTFTIFQRQLAFSADAADGKLIRGLHNVKMEITTTEYFGTFQPALEWLLNSLAEYHPTQATLVALIQRYREQCKAAIVLNAIISSFDASVIATNALPMCDLIKESDARGYSRHHLYVSLGRVLCKQPPKKDELLQVLNDVWAELGASKSARIYVDVAAQYLQLLLTEFGVPEVHKLLKDLLKRVSVDKAYTELYGPLACVVSTILEQSGPERLGTIFVLEPLQRLLALFDREHAVEIWRRIMEAFAATPGTFVDPVLVNSLMQVARQLHDSIDATSFDDERRQLGVLITAFIRKVGFGADFEAQLSFYVDCRAAFVNLDAVHSTLVLGVTQLMMSTRALVRGRHTKKTGAFERACAAFVFITVPTIEAPLMRIKLNLLGAQVALANQLLPQVDALVMAAVTAVPEVLAEGEHAEAQGNLAVREANGREEALLEVLSSLCAFLVVVPGHPKNGPFYLAAGLLNQVQKPKLKWRLLASKPLLYLRMLALFSTYAQRQLPYRVPGVDSNDVLYASEPEYTEKLQELISSLLGELEAALSALGELAATEANAARALVAILTQWLELAVGTAEPSKPIVALCAKLLGLAAKVAPTPNDKAQLRNTAAHVARLAIQHGGAYVDLSQRLQKTLSESAALKR